MNDSEIDLTAERVQELVLQGEGPEIEFKISVPPPPFLSRLIGGFANSRGGIILFGIREPGEIIGADIRHLRKVFTVALDRMSPKPSAVLHELSVQGKPVGAIVVSSSPGPVMSDAGYFFRVEDRTQPMTPNDLAVKLVAPTADVSTEDLALAISRQTRTIEKLETELREANSLRSKVKDCLIGGAIGALLGYLLSLAT